MKICKLGCPLRNVGTHSGQWSGKWRGGYWEEHCTPNESPLPAGLGQALGSIESQFLISGAKKKIMFPVPRPPPCDGEDEMGEKYELEFGSCTALDMNMKYQSLQDAARLSTS